MAGVAVALRFVPYSDDHGNFGTGWTAFMIAVVPASGSRRASTSSSRSRSSSSSASGCATEPGTEEFEIEAEIERELETGEFPAVGKGDTPPLKTAGRSVG